MAKTINRIPTPAEPVVDRQTGLMTVSWYDYFNGLPSFSNLKNFANDAAAAAGGIPVGGFYRNGSVLMIRVA